MSSSYNTESGNNYSSSHIRKIELKNAQTQAQYAHEEEMARIEQERILKEKEIELNKERESKQLGWLGCIFGGPEGASKYITATICIIILIAMIILSVCLYDTENGISNIKEIWGIGTPILTLSLGYLFGKQ